MQLYYGLAKRFTDFFLLLLVLISSSGHAAEIDPSRFAVLSSYDFDLNQQGNYALTMNITFSNPDKNRQPHFNLQVLIHGFLASDNGLLIGRPSIEIVDVGLADLDLAAYTENGNPTKPSISNALHIDADTLAAANTMPSANRSNSWEANNLSVSANPTIPEPSPLILAALGILGAIIATYRKKTLS